MPLERIPTPNDEIELPVAEMAQAAIKANPKIRHWWVTTYGCVATFLPISSRNVVNGGTDDGEHGCTTDTGNGETCPNKAEFITIGVFTNQKSPVKVLDTRVRRFCPACLYRSMTKALSGVSRPEFFRKSNSEGNEPDPDSVYTVSERADFLQYCIQEIVEWLENNEPHTLEELNQEIMDDGAEKQGASA